MVKVELWDKDGSESLKYVVIPQKSGSNKVDPFYRIDGANVQDDLLPGYSHTIVGNLVASLQILEDLDGKQGHFFIFQDLSVRVNGQFRLKVSFSIFVLFYSFSFSCIISQMRDQDPYVKSCQMYSLYPMPEIILE